MISTIHKIHMDISYNYNNLLFNKIGRYATTNNSNFIHNIIICFNKKINFDLTFEFMKNKMLYKYLTEFANSDTYKQIDLHCPTDIIIKEHKNDCINKHLYNFVEIYNKILELNDKNIWQIMYSIYWIFIHPLVHWFNSNELNMDINYLSALIHFVSHIKWFHFNMHVILIKKILNETSNEIIIMGNINHVVTHHLYTLHKTDELKCFIKEEIPSHSIAIIIKNAKCFIYDPDYINRDITSQIKKLLLSVNSNIKYKHIKLTNPIQSITDDNYCIFHCIFLILDAIKMNDETLEQHIKYLDKQNKDATIGDIRKKIINELVIERSETISETKFAQQIVSLRSMLGYAERSEAIP